MASAVGFIWANMYLKAMSFEGGPTIVTNSSGQKMVLNVWPFDSRLGTDESTGFEVIGRAKPRLGQHPLCADTKFAEQS